MSARVGINGFGRMGRLALRAAWDWPELHFIHVNEIAGDAATAAHLLTFDSVHGRWSEDVSGDGSVLAVDGTQLGYSQAAEPGKVPWGELGVDIVLECTGRFRTADSLEPYFDQGVERVIVAAPVKERALNVVVVGGGVAGYNAARVAKPAQKIANATHRFAWHDFVEREPPFSVIRLA